MTSSTYNLSRSQASSILNISTRTLDRYIRRGKLSYKKVANKVLLSPEEVDSLKEELNSVNKEVYHTDVIGNASFHNEDEGNQFDLQKKGNSLEEYFQKLNSILQEKDRQLEEKNQLIYSMQKTLGEYETKLNNSVALPDYKAEKENHNIEKEKLKLEKQYIDEELKREKIKNLIYTSVLMFFVFVFIFVLFI